MTEVMQKGTYRLKRRDDGTVVITLKPRLVPVTVDPPESIIDRLSTNEDADWPFLVWDRSLHEIQYITIHHSAGSRETTNIEYWHRLHTQSKSWSRVGYHFGIAKLSGSADPIGLYQMNYLSTVSWHDTRNYNTVGVTFGGDMRAGHDGRPNEEQLDGFGRLMAWLVPQLPNLKNIVGHKWWSNTACPGDLHVWADDLVYAAAKYGIDIAPLLNYQAGVARRAINALTLRAGPEAE